MFYMNKFQLKLLDFFFVTNLIAVLILERRNVRRADVSNVLQILGLIAVAALDPFHLLGTVLLYAMHLLRVVFA